MIYIQADDFFKDIKENVKKRFSTCSCEVDRPLLMGKALGMMKDELGGVIMKECFVCI